MRRQLREPNLPCVHQKEMPWFVPFENDTVSCSGGGRADESRAKLSLR
jgi:hypothetical protein